MFRRMLELIMISVIDFLENFLQRSKYYKIERKDQNDNQERKIQ